MGILLHKGRSTAECVIDWFIFDVSTKTGANAEVIAAKSDTTGNMNKFGQLPEDMGIHYPYCSDHSFHLTCKKLYQDVTFEEGGLPNINSPSTCVEKAHKLVMFFNKSTQATAKLKLAQPLLSSVANTNVSYPCIVILHQDITDALVVHSLYDSAFVGA